MGSNLESVRWVTAKTLHQIQLLSCDLSDFVRWDVADHAAPFWRLYWHDRRGGEISLEGNWRPVRPGYLMLIPPNTHFSSRLKNPMRQLFLHFLVEPRFRGTANTVFEWRATREQEKVCARIVRELTTDTSSIRSSLLGQSLVASVLLRLPLDGWTPRFEDPRITRAVEAIVQAYPGRIENARLARDAGMHPSSFARLFRQCTGHSPLEYLMNLRLEEACSMLHYDDASLDEIAVKTGFGERGYFTRVFSRGMNCPPAKYRSLVNVSNRLRPGA